MSPRHRHAPVPHDAEHHAAIHRRGIAAVLNRLNGDCLGSEAVLMEAECLLCVARALTAWVAALDGDADAVNTNIVAHQTLAEVLGHEPPDDWPFDVPLAPADLGLLP